ncbi:hypothetical protein NFI96_023521, partial [Prochilodus magdalenae]
VHFCVLKVFMEGMAEMVASSSLCPVCGFPVSAEALSWLSTAYGLCTWRYSFIYLSSVLYFVDLSRPADLGLNHTVNMYLSSEEGVTLGVWHTVPEHMWKEAQGKGQDWYEKSLGDGSPVFIYLHGNADNRALPHRIGVANVISSLGYHAVALDYRGFGDSTGEPTEAGLINDALYLYHWVRKHSKGSLLVIWGHSIGTFFKDICLCIYRVTTNIAVKLQEQGNPPEAVILEGAFTDEILRRSGHPFAWFYRRFPYIQYYLWGIPKESKTAFPNEVNIGKMKMPILMLHAEDDHVTFFKVAQELYNIARSALNSDEQIKLVSFDSSLGYRHNGLYRDPALPGIIKSSWKGWLKWAFLVPCVLYVASPFLLRLFPGFVQHMVYAHGVLYFVDLSRPADLGLNHTVNMYLSSEEGVTLGVWHTVPEHMWKEAQGKGQDWYEKSLGDGSPVVIYLHGNTRNRAAPHRIGVANILSSLGYHAVVMDYRGFGDSTGEPTESGLTADALYLYNWVRERSKDSLLVIWGQSLGTGVSTNIAVKLQEQGYPFGGVILEGAIKHARLPEGFPHPFTWYYWRFPYIQYYFDDRIKKNKLSFSNDENLKKMRKPLLILHSKDDNLVPSQSAEELYSIAKTAMKSDELVKLVLFDGPYLHNGIYQDPALPGIIRLDSRLWIETHFRKEFKNRSSFLGLLSTDTHSEMRRRVDEVAGSGQTEKKSAKAKKPVETEVRHTVPEHMWKEAQGKGQDWYEKSLGDGSPVFIYLHGNTNNRAAPHRIGVANILSSLGYHAVVMDYRGFGDSTGEPTVPGLNTDALYLYNWVRERSKDSLLVIWGHSLGTGVSTNIAVKLQEQGYPFGGVILEGAFKIGKIPKGIPHPFTWYYWRFPYIQYYFDDRINKNKVSFSNDENLKKMRKPLLILHSKDDHLVPYHVAEELYSIAKTAMKSDELVKLVLFDGPYLHNKLYRDPALPGIIR